MSAPEVAPVVAAVAAAGSVALLWPSMPRPPASRRRLALVLVPGAVAWAVGVRLHAAAGPAALAVLAGAAVWWLRGRWADRRVRTIRAAAVLELCEELAGDLAAGSAPGTALGRAARRWPELTAPATAHRLGASVPAAWRVLAERPGAGDLHVVAAAWQVAERTGAGLAEALAGVAAGIREQQRTRRLVASELASARATARLMAALPLLTLAVGSGAGDPVGFLLGTPAGLACAAGGLVLAVAGVAWIEAIASALERDAAWQPGPTR